MRPKNADARFAAAALAALAILYSASSLTGITWGLPTSRWDDLLFGGDPAWTGDYIMSLAGGRSWSSPTRGADVDADPLPGADGRAGGAPPALLNGDPAGVAAILLRYRLYTYQPDEMIVMRALGGMRPAAWDFDPRLYQYGGLFLYPVGALIRLAGSLGFIDVRGDVAYYLDHPDVFARFYVVSRGYSAAWGLAGLLVVFAIGRRLAGVHAGLLAALLFVLMPVVVCMAHEGKPHLPGAVLMLAAVWLAMRTLDDPPRRWSFVGLGVACGASLGMVLSSLPVFVLIPLAAHMMRRGEEPARIVHPSALRDTLVGLVIAAAVYLATNPYLLINAFANRDVLRSNFGNSLAMYEVARVGAGLVRVAELTVEGATLPIAVAGVVAAGAAVQRRVRMAWSLMAPAAVVFVQFVLIGAGKPAEYGRFGVFVDAALAIGAAAVVVHLRDRLRLRAAAMGLAGVLVVAAGWRGGAYLKNFTYDGASSVSSRVTAGRFLNSMPAGEGSAVAVLNDPAPYNCPPIDFARIPVFKLRSPADIADIAAGGREPVLVAPVDVPLPPDPLDGRGRTDQGAPPPGWVRFDSAMGDEPVTAISWANKPLMIVMRSPDLSLE